VLQLHPFLDDCDSEIMMAARPARRVVADSGAFLGCAVGTMT
jgi:hypothetical protein